MATKKIKLQRALNLTNPDTVRDIALCQRLQCELSNAPFLSVPAIIGMALVLLKTMLSRQVESKRERDAIKEKQDAQAKMVATV